MKPTLITDTVTIQLDTRAAVDDSGKLVVTVTAPLHGGAKKTAFGTLEDANGGWIVRDGTGNVVVTAESKSRAIRAFADLLVVQMAGWTATGSFR